MNWKMKKYSIKTISWVACLILLTAIGCTETNQQSSRVDALPYYSEATFTPQWFEKDAPELKDFHKISPFKLLNQDGETITEKTFEDKIYVVDFFFATCPGICPKMTVNMGILQDEFIASDDVLLLSHSVTPERDSVAALKDYAESKDIISGKWHLATGERETIYKLGRFDYFVEEDLGLEKEVDDFLHTENFVLIDKNQHIRGIYNGLNKTAIAQLIIDIMALEKEG